MCVYVVDYRLQVKQQPVTTDPGGRTAPGILITLFTEPAGASVPLHYDPSLVNSPPGWIKLQLCFYYMNYQSCIEFLVPLTESCCRPSTIRRRIPSYQSSRECCEMFRVLRYRYLHVAIHLFKSITVVQQIYECELVGKGGIRDYGESYVVNIDMNIRVACWGIIGRAYSHHC